jgi:hypothetical protein
MLKLKKTVKIMIILIVVGVTAFVIRKLQFASHSSR